MSNYNVNTIRSILSLMFDVNAPENKDWIAQLSSAIKTLSDDNVDVEMAPDIIIKNPKKYAKSIPQFFKRFKTFIEISDKETASGNPPTFSTIADYVKGEREYINT